MIQIKVKVHNLGVNIVLLPKVIQLFLFLLSLYSFKSLISLIVEDNQVSTADIKTREMIAGILRVEYILVNYECRSSGFGGISTLI